MGGDAESGKVLRAVHKKVVDQQLWVPRSSCWARRRARTAGVVEELVSKQPKPTSGRTTKEEYDEGVRLGAAGDGDGDGGGAAGRRIEVPDDMLKQVVSGLNARAQRRAARSWATRRSRTSTTTTATRGRSSW